MLSIKTLIVSLPSFIRRSNSADVLAFILSEMQLVSGNSLRDAASVAYEQVFAPHHGWAIRKAVAAGMYALPSKSQLLKRLNEDECSAKVEMQSFIRTSGPVIQYVEELFNSRQLGIEW